MKKKNILVASAWPYVNGSLHLGHVASLLGADILSRYYRLKGDNVLFVSGSDCYGAPVSLEAFFRKVEPAEIAEHYHKEFTKTFEDLSFSYDLYSRTTSSKHKEIVQEVFLKLYENGHIYKKETYSLYSPYLNRFLPDRFVEGTCPNCGFNNARGDQCDECDSLIEAIDLGNPLINSKILAHDISEEDKKLEKRKTEHFYFKLNDFSDDISSWVNEKSSLWRTNTTQVTKSFLKKGLIDRAITRDTDWGIPIPLSGYDEKSIYVWFDALLGYLSASMECKENWKDWWENENAKHYYVHGKDNIVFHSIILPSIFLGFNKLHLPDVILSSEHLTFSGKQFSKSRGNVLSVKDFLNEYDSETLRYFLIVQGPETGDSDFNLEEFKKKVNGELIGTFGNLINRIFTFVEKHYPNGVNVHNLDKEQEELLNYTQESFSLIGKDIEAGKFRSAFRNILSIAERCNKFVQVRTPWENIKENKDEVEKDLAVLLKIFASLSILIEPFLPKTAENIQKILNIQKKGWCFVDQDKFLVKEVKLLFNKID